MKILKEYFFWIPIILMVISALAKFQRLDSLMEEMIKIGLQDQLILLGIMEIGIVAVFMIRRTLSIGFFLICSYWGGAIAVNLTNGILDFNPIIILALSWIAVYFKYPSLFTPEIQSDKYLKNMIITKDN